MDESMNIQTIKDSGDLELYVMGALPEESMRNITSLAKLHPALQHEIEAIEATLISYAEVHAGNGPSSAVLAATLAQINQELSQPSAKKSVSENSGESKVRSMSFQPLWAWAAAVAMLLMSGAANFFLYTDLNTSERQLLALQQEKQELATIYNQTSADLESMTDAFTLLENPSIRRIELGGTEAQPESKVAIFWDTAQGNVLLAFPQLPTPPTGFQYQLWAIVDGTPVDAGMLTSSNQPQRMKPITGEAAAFAITLEKEGGSPVPTLTNMYVIGNV